MTTGLLKKNLVINSKEINSNWINLPQQINVMTMRLSHLPTASGIPMSTSLSNRPNLLRAGSMELGRLVAAMTMTWDLCLRPSINVSNWETIRRSTSPWVFSLFGAIESNSSMKIMAAKFVKA